MENTIPAHPVARLRHPDGDEFLLYPGRSIRLGRSCENDVVFNDPKISRFHALLEWNGCGFAVRDLGSSNGTQVNQERVMGKAGHTLRDGDQIVINKRVLIFEIVRAEESQPLAAPRQVDGAPPLGARGPLMLVKHGPDAGSEYPLWGERVTIGRISREVSCEIRLSDPSISRPHISIEQRNGSYYLIDLDSVNGTLLNGQRLVQPACLQTGDEIQIGETCLVFYHHK